MTAALHAINNTDRNGYVFTSESVSEGHPDKMPHFSTFCRGAKGKSPHLKILVHLRGFEPRTH